MRSEFSGKIDFFCNLQSPSGKNRLFFEENCSFVLRLRILRSIFLFDVCKCAICSNLIGVLNAKLRCFCEHATANKKRVMRKATCDYDNSPSQSFFKSINNRNRSAKEMWLAARRIIAKSHVRNSLFFKFCVSGGTLGSFAYLVYQIFPIWAKFFFSQRFFYCYQFFSG